MQNQRLACAISAFQSAIGLDGNFFEARYNLGAALAESGDLVRAAEHLRVAVRLQPADENARAALKAVEERLGETASGDSAATHFNRSLELLRNNRNDEARAELEQAVRIRPDFTEALANLGVLYQRQGRTREAEQLFRRAIAGNPRYAAGYLNLGLTLVEQKRFTESIQVLRRGLDIAPRNTPMLTALGMALMRMGQMDEAADAFRKVVALRPRSAESHLNLGIALADHGQAEAALPSFDEAVRLDPRSAPAHFNRGRALAELRRFPEAKSEFETALKLQPNDAATLLRLGMTESALGRQAEAAELLHKAVAADPSSARAHQELGQVLVDLGREDEALTHLKRAAALNPADSQTVYAVLRILTARKSPEASEYSRRVREMKRDELAVTQAQAAANFALDAAKAKEWPKAIGQLRQAIQTCGECPIRPGLHKNLGLILAQSGDVAGARAELQTAANLNPDDGDTRYALEVLSRLRAR